MLLDCFLFGHGKLLCIVPYLLELEIEGLGEGLAAEIPKALIGWIDTHQRLHQEADRLYNLSHHQIHSHRHKELLICKGKQLLLECKASTLAGAEHLTDSSF